MGQESEQGEGRESGRRRRQKRKRRRAERGGRKWRKKRGKGWRSYLDHTLVLLRVGWEKAFVLCPDLVS